jgi:hypothetical protein
MALGWEYKGVRLVEERVLHDWDTCAKLDPRTTAADLAHAIRFGKAQSALEAVAAGGATLTTDHAWALHFANEMAELRHYGPLIAVEDNVPVLAPGIRQIIGTFDEYGLWDGQPGWTL